MLSSLPGGLPRTEASPGETAVQVADLRDQLETLDGATSRLTWTRMAPLAGFGLINVGLASVFSADIPAFIAGATLLVLLGHTPVYRRHAAQKRRSLPTR